MSFFAKYKNQYLATLRLAIPVMLSQAGQIVVQMADNIMVGRLGAVPLAAVSFSGTVYFMVFILGIGLSLGITPLVGELHARNDFRGKAAYLQNAVGLYAISGVAFFAVLYGLIPLMHHLGQPQEVVDMAIPYYKYLVWSIMPFMIFASLKQFLEGVGNTKMAMYIVLSCDLLNVILNYMFIYGHFGATAMGAAGAGLATLISRLLMPVAMFAYLMSKSWFRRYFRLFDRSLFSWQKVVSLLKVGFPISLQMFMESAAFCVSAIMIGWIGTIPIAANQVATTTANFAFLIVLGISSAATIRVSHQYGRRDVSELKLAANSAYHIGIVWNLFSALLFIIFRNDIPRLFTDDPEVVSATAPLIVLCGIFQISDGLQSVSSGILRGLQDVKSMMRIAFISYIAVNIPLGYFATFVLGWGTEGMWFAYIIGLSLAAFLLNRRYRKTVSRIQ